MAAAVGIQAATAADFSLLQLDFEHAHPNVGWACHRCAGAICSFIALQCFQLTLCLTMV
jgi:hypothetical protein